MSTKLQEYKRARHPTGHKNIRARKMTTLSFDEWLRPRNFHRLAVSGPHVAYASSLINDIKIPVELAIAEIFS